MTFCAVIDMVVPPRPTRSTRIILDPRSVCSAVFASSAVDFFFPSTQTFSSSVTAASNVSTDASANAPGVLKSAKITSTCKGIVLVSPEMRPDTT